MQVKSSPKVQNFLASPTGQRFLKLAGMLGSDGDGERANASAMANRLLREAELTWGEVLAGTTTADSRGGQQTTINDLRARLRVAEAGRAEAARRVNDLEHRLARATREGQNATENLRQTIRDLTAKLAKAHATAGAPNAAPTVHHWSVVENPFDRLATITVRVPTHEAMKVFTALSLDPTINDLDPVKAGRSRAGTGEQSKKKRVYATQLQRQINELVDEIEAGVELNQWETDFVTSVRELRYKISEKQVRRLKILADQAGVECTIEPVGYD